MMELNCCSYCRVSLCESGSWMCAKVFPHSRYKRQRRNTVEIQWIGVPHKRTVSPWQCGMRVHKKSRSFSHWLRLRYPALGSKDNKTLWCIQCASWRLLTCTHVFIFWVLDQSIPGSSRCFSSLLRSHLETFFGGQPDFESTILGSKVFTSHQ